MSELNSLTAVVLAGGLGTRLRSVVSDRPKVLAEVHGRPFLCYLLDTLVTAGIARVVICTGYRGEMVRQAFGSRYRSLSLYYSQEETPLGTGGALRASLSCTDAGTILALNGDSLCRTDLAEFAGFHAQHQAAISLLLAQIDDTSRYGRVEVDAEGRVVQFVEKTGRLGPGWINAGIYLIERRVVESIAPNANISLERTVLPNWLARGLYGHRGGRELLDIGTPESYASAAGFVAVGATSSWPAPSPLSCGP
jgi:NDP-sugar pyrophosphorylase family protein